STLHGEVRLLFLLFAFLKRSLQLLAIGPDDAIVELADDLPFLDALSLDERLFRLGGGIVQEPHNMAFDGRTDAGGAIGQRLRRAENVGPLAEEERARRGQLHRCRWGRLRRRRRLARATCEQQQYKWHGANVGWVESSRPTN